MNLQTLLAHRFADVTQTYTPRDSILYALGVGFAAQPLDAQHLKYLYEDGLVAVPTLANVLAGHGFWQREPQFGIDWPRLLHAEQRLTLHRSVPGAATLIGRTELLGLRDRGVGNGAFMHQRRSLVDAISGEPVASIINSSMMRGDGGCGDHGAAPSELEPLPSSQPEVVVALQIDQITPLIYRLSGDYNPLHIDPAVASGAGFPRPILHGLSSMGHACYALLKTFCHFDAARLQSMAVRFTRPVLPGDRVEFDFWQTQPGVLRFRARVPSRGLTVLDRGTAQITPG